MKVVNVLLSKENFDVEKSHTPKSSIKFTSSVACLISKAFE